METDSEEEIYEWDADDWLAPIPDYEEKVLSDQDSESPVPSNHQEDLDQNPDQVQLLGSTKNQELFPMDEEYDPYSDWDVSEIGGCENSEVLEELDLEFLLSEELDLEQEPQMERGEFLISEELSSLKPCVDRKTLNKVQCQREQESDNGENVFVTQNNTDQEKLRADLECSIQKEKQLQEDNITLNKHLEEALTEVKALSLTLLERDDQLTGQQSKLATAEQLFQDEKTALQKEVETTQAHLSRAIEQSKYLKDRLTSEGASHREEAECLTQKLSKAETQVISLEDILREKDLQIDILLKDKAALVVQAKDLDRDLCSLKESASGRHEQHELTKKDLLETKSECLSLQKQLEKTRSNRDREVKEQQEENDRLLSQNTDLKHQLCRLETDKVEMEASLSQLKQELSESMEKLSNNTTVVEENHQYCNSLEKEKEKASDTTIKHLEETVQRMSMEKTQLETAAQNQSFNLRTLEMQADKALKERVQLQEMISHLQSCKFSLEEQLGQVKQEDSTLSHEGQGYQASWENEVKRCSKLELRLSELQREKEQLSSKVETIKTKAKLIVKRKNIVETRLQDEMTRNTELQTEVSRLRTSVNTAKKELHDMDMEEEKIREDVQALLNKETQQRHQLERDYGYLVKEVTSLKHSLLDRQRTEDELRSHLAAAEREHSQIEERSRQQLQRQLDEVNAFLRTQYTQKSLLSKMENRIKELESQESENLCSKQDIIRNLDMTQTELQRYKSKYSDERHLRKSLAAKLQQTDSSLSEAKSLLKELVNSPRVVGSRRY